MRAFWILSCLALAAAKPQYNYEQPAGQYYSSNVVQQQYPASAFVGQQQQQLLPAVSAYTGQSHAAGYVQQSLPASYSSLGSSVASQPQSSVYPSQNLYTSYAQSPSYQGLIASPAPGVSYTGYTGYTSLQSGYSANAQTSFVQGQTSNDGYYNNVYSQNAVQQAPLAPEQTYLPAHYSAGSANANINTGTLEQFANQHEQLQATQAPIQQTATFDQNGFSVSSQSADVTQQHLSVEQKLPESLPQPQEQLALPEPTALPQVVSTSVPQLEQSYQSGYHQAVHEQPAQTYLPAGAQQTYQSQPEQSYQSIQQTYQAGTAQSHSVEVQQSIQIEPEQSYQSAQQTYHNEAAQNAQSELHQSFQSQPEQTYLPALAQQTFQNQPEQSYQSVQQSYHAQSQQNVQAEPQQPEPSPLPQLVSTSVPQLEQSFQSEYQQTVHEPVQTYLPAGAQQTYQSQSEQSYESAQQSYQTETAHNVHSEHQQSFQSQPEQTYLPAAAQQSFQSQPEQSYQSIQQSYQAQPQHNVESELQQSFQSQSEQSVENQSEEVYQSQAVHSIETHQQTFEPQIQSETEPRALQPAVQTTIHKSIYVHVPPKELEEEEEELPVQPISPPKKHYKVIFIKAPSPAASRQIIQQIQPQAEEKTLVYVLVKKPEAPELRHLQQPEVKTTDKPEVYFIKYRAQKEQKKIEQVSAVEPTVQAVPALHELPALPSVETAPLASQPMIIEPRQNQPSHPPQFPALEEQNNLPSTEGSNDEVQIPATTRRPHHHLRVNSSKLLQKTSAHKPAKDYLPANVN